MGEFEGYGSGPAASGGEFAGYGQDTAGAPKGFERLFGARGAPEGKPVKPDREVGIGESLRRGFGAGGSLGFGDEIGAALDTAVSKIPGLRNVEQALRTDKNLLDISDPNITYAQRRENRRQLNDEAQRANPGAFLAGELGGGLATLPAGGGAGTLRSALKTGATLGGISGLGNSKADLTKGEVGQAALDTAKGAGAGALASGAVYGAAKGVGKLVSMAQEAARVADQKAAKAVGGATTAAEPQFDAATKQILENLEKQRAARLGRGEEIAKIDAAIENFKASAKRNPSPGRPAVTLEEQLQASINVNDLAKQRAKLAKGGPTDTRQIDKAIEEIRAAHAPAAPQAPPAGEPAPTGGGLSAADLFGMALHPGKAVAKALAHSGGPAVRRAVGVGALATGHPVIAATALAPDAAAAARAGGRALNRLEASDSAFARMVLDGAKNGLPLAASIEAAEAAGKAAGED